MIVRDQLHLDIQKQMDNGDCLILVGAGISRDYPTCMPTGIELTRAFLFHTAPYAELQKQLDSYAFPKTYKPVTAQQVIRFEHIIGALVDHGIDPHMKLLKSVFNDMQPNANHLALRELIKKGNIVLTTNYDNCIEGEESKYVPVLDLYEGGWKTKPVDSGFLIKLHGSIDSNARVGHARNIDINTGEVADYLPNIVSTLRSLTAIREYFSTANTFSESLRFQIEERPLVVMGYSGMDDFDIVPYLLETKSNQPVYWFAHTKAKNCQVIGYSNLHFQYNYIGSFNTNHECLVYQLGALVRSFDSVYIINTNIGAFLSKNDVVVEKTKDYIDRTENIHAELSKIPIGHIWFMLGALLLRIHAHTEAIALYKYMLKQPEELVPEKTKLNIKLNLAEALFSTDKNLEAEAHARDVVESKLSEDLEKAKAKSHLAHYLSNRDRKKAMELYYEAGIYFKAKIKWVRYSKESKARIQFQPGIDRYFLGCWLNYFLLSFLEEKKTLKTIYRSMEWIKRFARTFGERYIQLLAESTIYKYALHRQPNNWVIYETLRDITNQAAREGEFYIAAGNKQVLMKSKFWQ